MKKIIRKIRAYDDESGRRRPHLWYLAGAVGFYGEVNKPEWIDHALEADYRRNPKWQKPSIVSHYPDRDPREFPDWEPGKRGFMEPIWWVTVIVFSVIVSAGIIWGLMNRAGA